ncbi:MAG: hypothetical protein ABEN55_06120, partial [Bradymonadaceae bacterium]
CWGVVGVTTPKGAGARGEPLSFTGIDAGNSSNCGRLTSSHNVQCWDDDDGTPPDGAVQMVDAGGQHQCAIRSSSHSQSPEEAVCWGTNIDGKQLDGAPATKLKDLSVGNNTACGITSSGNLRCWTVHFAFEPPDQIMGNFTAVSVGANSVCTLDPDGRAKCWGSVCGGDPNKNNPCWAP